VCLLVHVKSILGKIPKVKNSIEDPFMSDEKLKLTPNTKKVCVYVLSVNKIITMRKLNNTRFLLTKWKTQYEKNQSVAAKPRISTIQKTRLDTK
jgi:hypothetical protein